MPKLKTNRAAAKRFRRTKNGKFLRGRAGGRHLKTVKSPKRIRNLRAIVVAEGAEQKRLERLLPYA